MHLDHVIAPFDGRPTSATQIVDHLPLGDGPQHFGVEVGHGDGGTGSRAWTAPLPAQLGGGVAPRHLECPRFGGAFGPGHDLTAPAELLEGEQPDRLLSQGSFVVELLGIEQVAGDLAKTVGTHAAAVVVDGDQRVAAHSAQHDPDALTMLAGHGVLVGRVRHEFVQRVLRVLEA